MRTFRIVAHNGLAVSRDVFYEQAYRLPDDLEASGWFIPEKSKITTEFRDMLATSMSQAHTFDAKSAVDAALARLCSLSAGRHRDRAVQPDRGNRAL